MENNEDWRKELGVEFEEHDYDYYRQMMNCDDYVNEYTTIEQRIFETASIYVNTVKDKKLYLAGILNWTTFVTNLVMSHPNAYFYIDEIFSVLPCHPDLSNRKPDELRHHDENKIYNNLIIVSSMYLIAKYIERDMSMANKAIFLAFKELNKKFKMLDVMNNDVIGFHAETIDLWNKLETSYKQNENKLNKRTYEQKIVIELLRQLFDIYKIGTYKTNKNKAKLMSIITGYSQNKIQQLLSLYIANIPKRYDPKVKELNSLLEELEIDVRLETH